MRKYRAIPVGEKDFVHGGHCELEGRHFIIPPDAEVCEPNVHIDPAILGAVEVIPETVGQSTGLKEIYEGDIVAGSYGIPPVRVVAPVEYDGSAFVIKTPKHTPKEVTIRTAVECLGIEAIGDIHHPELKEQR
jgi:hypothetical protein